MESRKHMQRRMDAVLALKNNITASRVGGASPLGYLGPNTNLSGTSNQLAIPWVLLLGARIILSLGSCHEPTSLLGLKVCHASPTGFLPGLQTGTMTHQKENNLALF